MLRAPDYPKQDFRIDSKAGLNFLGFCCDPKHQNSFMVDWIKNHLQSVLTQLIWYKNCDDIIATL